MRKHALPEEPEERVVVLGLARRERERERCKFQQGEAKQFRCRIRPRAFETFKVAVNASNLGSELGRVHLSM